MTVIQHILQYLCDRLIIQDIVSTHDVEYTLPQHLVEKGIVHNPGTYSRKFRIIREHANEYGLSFETLNNGRKEKSWKVTVNDSLKLQQALSRTGVAV